MKKIEVICVECNKTFERDIKEVNRSKKIGRKIFCSLNCSCRFIDRERLNKGEILGKPFGKNNRGRVTQRDDLSLFRVMLGRIKKRHKDNVIKIVDITLEDLKELWEKQKGMCPYTGVKLILPYFDGKQKRGLYTASLDRIDSSKGYIKDNLQFVSYMINMAKNDLQENELREFCDNISKNWKNSNYGQVS